MGRIKQIGENPHRGFLNINDFKESTLPMVAFAG